MSAPELKPCPYCCTVPTIHQGKAGMLSWFACAEGSTCRGSDIQVMWLSERVTVEQAAQWWNRRAKA